jgi:hypothetical protein
MALLEQVTNPTLDTTGWQLGRQQLDPMDKRLSRQIFILKNAGLNPAGATIKE